MFIHRVVMLSLILLSSVSFAATSPNDSSFTVVLGVDNAGTVCYNVSGAANGSGTIQFEDEGHVGFQIPAYAPKGTSLTVKMTPGTCGSPGTTSSVTITCSDDGCGYLSITDVSDPNNNLTCNGNDNVGTVPCTTYFTITLRQMAIDYYFHSPKK